VATNGGSVVQFFKGHTRCEFLSSSFSIHLTNLDFFLLKFLISAAFILTFILFLPPSLFFILKMYFLDLDAVFSPNCCLRGELQFKLKKIIKEKLMAKMH